MPSDALHSPSVGRGSHHATALAEALFGRLSATLEFGLSSSDDEVMGASVDALAVLARHHIASAQAGRQGLRPTASSGAAQQCVNLPRDAVNARRDHSETELSQAPCLSLLTTILVSD